VPGHQDYRKRIVDRQIAESLDSAGAVLIRGPKACGKTYAAQQVAASEVLVDTDPRVPGFMGADPRLLLRGDAPRLLDEWQVYPELWNYVRREVDARGQKGQFILTGSANPVTEVKIHSGVGRFSIVRMRTFSRVERGLSNAQVSLADLLDPQAAPRLADVEERSYSIEDVISQLFSGGWPSLFAASEAEASKFLRDYIGLTVEVDIARLDGVKRDPAKVLRLLQSYARNIATQTPVSVMARDTRGDDDSFTDTTAYAYLEALERLMLADDLPAWPTHIRSRAALRTTPKRHFADPSLAVGALRLSVSDLRNDLNYTGFLFESSVVHDIRVYADAIGAEVGFFRDAKGHEVDIVVQRQDGHWAGFEVKLGDPRIDEGASALKKLLELIDFSRVPQPSSLNVVTSSGFPYRRADGINVVPISVLTV
jgi:predicted AAA+ superfamily ATPase